MKMKKNLHMAAGIFKLISLPGRADVLGVLRQEKQRQRQKKCLTASVTDRWAARVSSIDCV